MTTLVAGGAGFIGSHLCDLLVSQGERVICVDNFLTGSRENIEHLTGNRLFLMVEADIIDALPIVEHCDRVYHLASPASPVAYATHAIATLRVNSEGTRYLLDRAHQWDARFLYASTSEIYGDPLEHPQQESYRGNVSTTGPRSMYDEGKRFGEALVSEYHRTARVDTRIARIFNTYGPRMALDDGRVVSNFVVQALVGAPLTIYGDGSQTRSFQYVSDLIAGLTSLMEASFEGPVNIGNPAEFTIQQLAELVLELTGSSSSIDHRPLPIDDPHRRQPDITLAREELGWNPQIDLSAGLQRTIPDFQKRIDAVASRRGRR